MSRGSKLWVLALGALVSAAATPSTAQVVVGGSTGPDVQVNWGVLDRLGPEPTLPGMLRTELRPPQALAPAADAGKGVQYKPYKAVAAPSPRPAHPPKKAQAAAVQPSPTKAVAKAPPKAAAEVAELAEAVRAPAPAPEPPAPKAVAAPAKPAAPDVPVEVPVVPKVETPKPNKAKGPEVSLPSSPAPVPVPPPVPPIVEAKPEPAKPVQLAPEPPKPVAPPPVPAPQIAKVEPPPAPPPVVAPAAPAPQQVASVPSGAGFVRKGDVLSVLFSGENARLPDQAKPELDKLAARMEKDEALSLQLLAYAEGDEAFASKARRLSLSRALEVRKYLMELGVRSTRIEVRALGNKIEGSGPGDRVDAVLAGR